jgi:hypothetical protein
LIDRPSLLPNVKGTINLQDLTAELSYKDLGGELKTVPRDLRGAVSKIFHRIIAGA